MDKNDSSSTHVVKMALERCRLSDWRGAASLMEDLVAHEPNNFDALQLLGLATFRAGNPTESLAYFERALRIHARHYPTLNNFANAVREAYGPKEAIPIYARAVAVMPSPNPTLLRNLGSAYVETDSYPEAKHYLTAACEIAPADPETWLWLGHLSIALGDKEAAREAYQAAAGRGPHLAEAHAGLAQVARTDEEAEDVLNKAVALPSALLQTRIKWLLMRQRHADWRGFREEVANVGEIIRERSEPIDPMSLAYLIDDVKLLRMNADRMALYVLRRGLREEQRVIRGQRSTVRIGFFSPDARNHPVAQALAGVIENIDQKRFESYVYATGKLTESPLRGRIRRSAKVFHELPEAGDIDLREQMLFDELDVLIDLAGYTEGGRVRVTASRPALKTVNWLGFPGSLGTGIADFIIADPVVIPESLSEQYAERVVRLPGCLLPADGTREVAAPRIRRDYGLPESGVILACFAQPQKWTDQVFSVWIQALLHHPDTVLWLAQPAAPTIARLTGLLGERGISPARIVTAPKLDDQADHLARYLLADIVLDTFPYGSHATALDALWVGRPMVAMQGNTFPSRVSASVLMAAGLGDWVANSLQEYAEKLDRLIRQPQERLKIRDYLTDTRDASALFNIAKFTRQFEAAIEQIVAH